MSSYHFRTLKQAKQRKLDLMNRYFHVSIEIAYNGLEFIVWYCCPKDKLLSDYNNKLGVKCLIS